MTVLSVEGATMLFGGVAAVDDVSLELADDRLLGFIGPNGAGKTTLMKIITGVLRPSRGKVVFRGADITRWPTDRRMRAGMALAQQITSPLLSMTALDNVALASGARSMAKPLAALLRTDRRKERDKARELLEFVGIGEAADKFPAMLPLGHLKRLELARALALEPTLLLLDEPLAGLSQSEAGAMADQIAALAGGGRSVLLIEHNIREVARICPEIYVQDGGRQLIRGTSAQVMASPELRAAYLGKGGEHA